LTDTAIPSILGMPLDVEAGDGIAACQPICGLVVVKALDEDGEVRYFTAATDGLKSVEAIGMARLAVLKLERGLTEDFSDDLPDAGTPRFRCARVASRRMTETVHRCPPDGGLTPRCGKTPFELPRTDRITSDPARVTCDTIRPFTSVPPVVFVAPPEVA
jgi:hypothetical protein